MNLPSISVVKGTQGDYNVYTAVAAWDGEIHTKKELVYRDQLVYPEMEFNIKKALAHSLLEYLMNKMK